MTQQPVANVNGVHAGRPSEIRLGTNATSHNDITPSEENQNDRAHPILNENRPRHPSRQSSGKQIPLRPKVASQLVNGDHGTASLENDPGTNGQDEDTQDNWQMRHGWEDQYNSEEYLSLLSSVS